MTQDNAANKDFPWLKSYPVDIDWFAQVPVSTLPDMFDASVKKHGDKTCLNFLGKTMTYKEVGAAVDAFAKSLQDQGIGKGNTVGLCLPNSPFYIIAYYGALKAGAIVANFNPLYADKEIEHQINDSKTDIMVAVNVQEVMPKVEAMLGKTCLKKIVACDLSEVMPSSKKWAVRLINKIKPLFKNNKKLAAIPTLVPVKKDAQHVAFSDMLKAKGKPAAVNLTPGDTAVLQYTGGTTGVPKGAELTHANLTANLAQANMWFTDGQAKPDKEKVLVVLPFFHVFSMTVQMNLTLSRGGELVMLPKFDPVQTLKAIDKEKPTMFAGVPTLYKALIDHKDVKKYDLSSLKICLSGGAAMNENVQKGWKALTNIDIVEGYGLSETSPIVIANPLNGVKKLNSIGMPIPATEVKISDLETKEPQPVTKEGEICLKGPQVMKGYFNNSAETDKVMDKDGFFHTGDVGYVDNDGYIFIVDRIKDMINVNGFKAFSRKIEDALMQHPAISEAVVIGVPDDRREEAVKAFIVFKEGQKASQADITAFLKDKLVHYEMPRHFDFRDALPKTMIGKPDKKALKNEEAAKHNNNNAPKP